MKDYAFLINWVLIIFGWWMVHRLNSKRELEKEKRGAANDVINKLETLEKKAKGYHTSPSRQDANEREIKHDIKLVIRRLNSLGMNNTVHHRKLIAQMRQSITSKNFESESFCQQYENDKLVADISISIDRIIIELEKILYFK